MFEREVSMRDFIFGKMCIRFHVFEREVTYLFTDIRDSQWKLGKKRLDTSLWLITIL